jgi:proton-translocating NADH-quinone oxidoreductase chain N
MNAPAFLGMIALPLVASPLIYLSGRLSGPRRGPALAQALAVIALAAAWIPFLAATRQPMPAIWTFGSISLVYDGLGRLLAAVALALGLMAAWFSGSYLKADVGQEKFYAMLVAIVAVMIGLGVAADLFNLWIWFEAMAVCSYLLVTFHREQPAALEAGVKYLVQSAAGSVMVLLGVAIVFGATGTLRLAAIAGAGAPSAVLLAAGALFVVGFGVKAALVPLHTWLPDAHAQAPSGISAMLSGVVIEAGLVAMLRTVGALGGGATWGGVLLALGAANMLVGNLMALRQTQIKRLLAFSSLAHVGYMLLGIGACALLGSELAAQGGVFHLVTHGLMKGLAFLAAGGLLFALRIQRHDESPLLIGDLSGAARRYPLAALALSVAVLGLGGLPPLAGFMSKWQIFVGGVSTASLTVILLVLLAALNSILSLAYYAPVVNVLYRRGTSPAVVEGGSMSVSMGLPLLAMGAAVVVIGVWPSVLNGLTEPAGRVLVQLLGGG